VSAVHVNAKSAANQWGRNGFDRVELGGQVQVGLNILDRSKTIVANNNNHFDSVRLAA